MVRRKKRSTRRSSRTSTLRRSRVKRRTVKLNVHPSILREVWAVIYLAVGVLTIVSLNSGFGIVGDWWIGFFRPMIGWGIYGVPAFFFLVAAMMFFSKKMNFGGSRIFGMFLLITSILSAIHLSVPLDETYKYAAEGLYGGYVGATMNFLMVGVLKIGSVGSAVIYLSLFLVSLILIFELSLADIMRAVVPKVEISAKESARRKTTSRREKKAEEKTAKSKNGELVKTPEIMIHKSRIRNDKDVDVIYEEDEVKAIKKKPTVKAAKKNMVEDVLDANMKNNNIADDDYVWEFPSLDLLVDGDSNVVIDEKVLMDRAEKISKKLFKFGIDVVMHEVNVGPTVVQYTLKPNEGVKLSKITSLKNDIALALAAERIRIEAPIPGKSLVGIEIPNENRATVYLKELLRTHEFKKNDSKLILPLGRDVSGNPIVANLESMPHLLIAGATGSGKSVCMNSFLVSLLYQNSPKDLKFIMIDPKRVELSSYNNIPHLLSPVIVDPNKAAISLRWVVSEMTRRYTLLAKNKVRNIHEFNDLKEEEDMPRIVVVIDELADLMMVAGKEVESSICRIAQMARAVGIHLIIATQRPSVNVITGLIKANIPARISFSVSSSIDSRTILDCMGAEDLVGKGDMLYLAAGKNKPRRVQGIYVSTSEIEKVTNRIKLTVEPDYNDAITESGASRGESCSDCGDGDPSLAGMDEDTMYQSAYNLVKESNKASASLFQRRLKVGYARAARLIDLLEEYGVVGPSNGAKPRKILI